MGKKHNVVVEESLLLRKSRGFWLLAKWKRNVRITENKWLEVKLDLKMIQISYTNFTPLKSIYNSQSRLST